MKFRSSTGSSVSSLVSKRVDTSARSVFRMGENPCTVTASLTSPTCNVHPDVWIDRLLEPGELDLHLVGAGQQPLLDVVASFIGHERVGRLALDARDGHRHSGQQSTRWITHTTCNAAVNCLGSGVHREPES